jgi:LuxR family glucitol operon transcriptional activator
LKEGILAVQAKRKEWTKMAIYRRIGEEMAQLAKRDNPIAPSTVERWARGNIPPESWQSEFLVEFCWRHGRVDRRWAESLLTHARHPNPEPVLDKVFGPPRIASAISPQIYENLPWREVDLIGRDGELAELLRLLGPEGRTWGVIVCGLGGVGKTSLVVKAGHRCLPGSNCGVSEPFDAVVFITAKDRELRLNDTLDAIGRTLQYPRVYQASDEQKPYQARVLLKEYRILLIVDNFETITDRTLAEFLHSVPAPSAVLVTTREFDPFIWNGPKRIELHGLEKFESYALIRQLTERPEAVLLREASEEQLLPLVEATDGNPFAIKTAVGYILDYGQPLDVVLSDLWEARGYIFDYIFSRAWERLDEYAQCVLMVMPLFTPSANRAAIGAAARVEGYWLTQALNRLVAMSLVEVTSELEEEKRRYSVHPLTRSFASGKLGEAPELEERARAHWVKYFLGFAASYIVRKTPEQRYWNSLGGGDWSPIDQDLPNLLSMLAWADRADQNEAHMKTLVELMMLLAHYLGARALFSERIRFARRAAEAANKLGQRVDEALLRIDALGWTLIEEGRLADAALEITAGLRIAEDLGIETTDASDLIALANAFLAKVYLQQEAIEKATVFIEKALSIECRSVIRYRVAEVGGELAHKKRDYPVAIRLFRDAIHFEQEYGGEAQPVPRAHFRLGFTYLAQGDLAQAEAVFGQVSAFDSRADTIEALFGKFGLAHVAKMKNEVDKARRLFQEASDAFSRLHIYHQELHEIANSLKDLEIK